MAARSELIAYVRDALSAGRSRDEIRAAMASAGWRDRDAARALAAFAEVDTVPPVPRPRPFVSARDAAVFALGFFALGVVVVNLVAALFDLIEVFTGALERPSWPRAQAWRVAAIAVFAPLFAVIDFRSDRESPVRKVFAYAAFFFAALVLLFTLVSVIALALGGGLDAEVGLKALTVAAVAGAVLLYYRSDLKADADPD